MSLDLSLVIPQVQDLGRAAAHRAAFIADKLPKVMEILHKVAGSDPHRLQAGIARVGERWPGAIPTEEPIDLIAPPPLSPARFYTIGVDGSQLYPDRHAHALYFMINIGSIVIDHGSGDPPLVNSQPRLYFEDEYLYGDNEGLITNALVDGLRDVAEMDELASQAERCIGEPTLALLDNGLLLWLALQVRESKRHAADRILSEYLKHLDRLRHTNTPVAGFVDRPRNANVLALLHMANVPLEDINEETLSANPFRGLSDGALFSRLLSPGQRSARFIHASPVNRDFQTAGHEVQFFYLNPGHDNQAVRVEIPCWVAEQAELLNLVHAGILEQCRVAGGFPYALVRAHELAVITHADRQRIDQMLVDAMLHHGLAPQRSRKSLTKKWTGQRRHHRL